MRHFLQPRLAATEDVRQWSALTESDWLQIHRKQQGEDDDMTGLAPLPGIADVCWLLEQCPSDALADFVWGHLLLSLLQQSNNTNETSTQQQLLSLLASHHSFASLSPKDFRAKDSSRLEEEQLQPTMERFRAGLRKGGAAAAAGKPTAPPATGKFKLRISKDPLPLLTKKDSKRGTKPPATFLKAATSTEKQTDSTKPGLFAASSFTRPSATDPPKTRMGFSFMKFQPKSNEPKKMSGNTSGKTVFAATKPLLSKLSVNRQTTKSSNIAMEAGTTTDKGVLLKPPVKGGLAPFAFRAETKSSTAKKRKAVELSTQGGRHNFFPNKSGRVESNGSFKLKNFDLSKEKDVEKMAGKSRLCNKDTQPQRFRGTFFLAAKKGSAVVKANQNDGVGLKKRGLTLPSAELGPAPKRSKQNAQPRENTISLANEAIESGDSPRDVAVGNEKPGLLPLAPLGFNTAQASPVGGAKSPQSSIAVPRSPDYREECLSGIEEELAIKLLCTLDDDKEDEFLIRAAAIEEFTGRVGLEQKQIHNRLLDAHADVSETLLDALTGLMAEEGGIGIDKLDYDMNMDVDVGDAFLQDNVTQLLD